MNQYNISGLLRTYSEKCRYARDEEHLEDLIKELIQDLEMELDHTLDEWGD